MVIKNTILKSLVVSGSLLFVSVSAADYSAWTHSTNILLNTSSTGAATSQAVNNFPVLIRLTQTNLTFSQVKAGGADLRFAKTNGTPLPYQIERWDATNQLADIWVKVDAILANQADQGFIMYWGNSAAVSESNGNAVFDTASGFVGVWHMADTADATVHGLTANKVDANQPASTTGNVGGAFDFNGTSDNMVVPFNQFMNVGRQITLNFWARYDGSSAPTSYNRLISRKNTWGDVKGWDIDLKANSNTGMSILTINSQGYNPDNIVSSWSQNAWHYISISYDKDTVRVYGDGAIKPSYFAAELQDSTKVYDNIIDSVMTFFVLDPDTFWTTEYIYDTTTVTQYGPLDCKVQIQFGAGDGTFFNGAMDEIRYERGVRSADWIKLCYENQKASQTLVTFGGTIGVIKPDSYKQLKGMRLHGAEKLRIIVFDMHGRIVANRLMAGNELLNGRSVTHLLTRQKIVGPGVYHVQIQSLDKSKQETVFEQKAIMVQQ